jgi:hypothetical protein
MTAHRMMPESYSPRIALVITLNNSPINANPDINFVMADTQLKMRKSPHWLAVSTYSFVLQYLAKLRFNKYPTEAKPVSHPNWPKMKGDAKGEKGRRWQGMLDNVHASMLQQQRAYGYEGTLKNGSVGEIIAPNDGTEALVGVDDGVPENSLTLDGLKSQYVTPILALAVEVRIHILCY